MMQALGRNPIAEHLSEKNVICSKHFYPEGICRGGNRIQLRSNAVPKLYLRKKYNIIQQGSSRVLQEMPHNRIRSEESPQEIAGSMDDMEVLFIDDKENTAGYTISCTAESSPISFTTSSTDSPGSLKRSREDTSTDSEGNKGEIKMARREIKIRHNYSAPPKLLRQLKNANVKKTLAQKKLKMAKVKVRRLKIEL
ncbi:hypothetical protein JTB14_033215 [Gonioctena quinquepunctata]|nr:hypothetical protein JTB14_033215 [Gonioctena quinquepunctata]